MVALSNHLHHEPPVPFQTATSSATDGIPPATELQDSSSSVFWSTSIRAPESWASQLPSWYVPIDVTAGLPTNGLCNNGWLPFKIGLPSNRCESDDPRAAEVLLPTAVLWQSTQQDVVPHLALAVLPDFMGAGDIVITSESRVPPSRWLTPPVIYGISPN